MSAEESDDFEILNEQPEDSSDDALLSLADPAETFSMIVLEQENIKRDITERTTYINEKLTNFEADAAAKDEKIANLRRQLNQLESQVKEKDLRIQDLSNEVQDLRSTASDKDRLVARLTLAQDTIKCQESSIRQLQSDGFVHVQPQLLADTMLAAELCQKDSLLESLTEATHELEARLVACHEEEEYLRRQNEDLRGEVAALKEQMRIDEDHRHGFVMANITDDDDTPTLRSTQESEMERCPHCHARIAVDSYSDHLRSCASVRLSMID